MDESIQQTIQELYGVELSDVAQHYRGVQFTLKSNPEQKYIFKPAGRFAHRIVFTYACMAYLAERNFTQTERYLVNPAGIPYVLVGTVPYIAVPIYRGRECSIEQLEEVCKSAEVLAELHQASVGFTHKQALKVAVCHTSSEFQGQPYVRVEAGKMPGIFEKRWKELERFYRLAGKSVHPFDCAYCKMAEDSIQRAQEVCRILGSGVYQRAFAACMEQGAICHKDFTAHNVLLCGGKAIVLNLDDCSIDLPICDLANLVKRRMRKCGWKIEDALRVIAAYEQVRPLSSEERILLHCMLAFPQKLWRVVNKYYNSKKTWCEKSCLQKLEEIQGEEMAWQGFLEALDISYTKVYH
ncbi:MAG: CotS family spore coat protein [Clostridia bacterium]|nr:CotS family spore coat protein [Clostridia bacterium]